MHRYRSPRPLFLRALVLSAWGSGLGPNLLGAALGAVSIILLFPEWLPSHGVVSNVVVYGFTAMGCGIFSNARLRTEAMHKSLSTEPKVHQKSRLPASQSYRESEGLFRMLADSAPVMIWMSGPDAGCTYFNKPWLDFRGRSVEQELGDGWSEGVHPDDLPACLKAYRSAFADRRPFTMEYRLRRADGEYRWVLDNGVPVELSEGGGFIGSCVDVTEQKLLEEKLRLSERRLMDAERLARVGSWERYLEADTIHWSDEMLRILGRPVCPPADFLTFLTYVHPDDREKIKDADHKVLSSDAPVVFEYRLVRADGQVRFVRSVVEVIRDQDGRNRISGATQDITQHVMALERLRKSEDMLRNAQRLSHVGNWEWDIQANRVLWSDETYRIFGQPRGFTPGYEAFLGAVRISDRERVQRGLEGALAGTKPYAATFHIVRPDGEERTLACIAEVIRDRTGTPIRMFGACQDITEKQRAEEERTLYARLVEKEHQRLNEIVSSIPGMVWETRGAPDDRAKVPEFVSERIQSLIGWSVDDWISKPRFCLSIVHPDDRERFLRESSEIFRSQSGSGSHQFRFLAKDGRYVWMESHINVVCDEKGERVGMRGVTMDISERKEAEAALIRTREELARVTRVISMGEVAASIAHEINQPLAAIVTNGEACLRWLSMPPNIDKASVIINSIIRDANRASGVIRGIRALLANGESQRDFLDLNQLTQETIALLQEHTQRHDVQVRTDLESQLPRVSGDRIQLQQVLMNLLLNGIDATRGTPPNGTHEMVVATSIDKPGSVLLEVRDCGPGIPPGTLDRIFCPFFTTKEAGVGMGLSISRTIVESHGGRIWVTANEPHGARFWVRLPGG